MNDKRGDDVDPSDWLAKQFGAPEEPEAEEPEAAEPETAEPAAPATNPPADAQPPTLVNPLDVPPVTAGPQGAFDWGLATSGVPVSPEPPKAPEPIDAAVAGAPSPATEPPAEPLPFEPAATEVVEPAATEVVEPQPTEIIQPEPQPTTVIPQEQPTEILGRRASREAEEPTAAGIDSLFGETQFKEYEDVSPLATIPFGAAAAATGGGGGEGGGKPPRDKGGPLPRNQKILLWVAGGLVALLALAALYFAGTRLPDLIGPAPAVSASSSPSATPTPTVRPVGPVAFGAHRWDALLGGECLDPYVSPWEERFTVVDCAAPHPAQLIYRGTFAPVTAGTDGSSDPYPGIEALQAKINLLCTAPTVIDLGAAGAYTDIVFQASYAATPDEWAKGQHDYYCFISRTGGQPITGSVAIPQAPAVQPAA